MRTKVNLLRIAIVALLVVMMLSGCVSQTAHDEVLRQNETLTAERDALKSQVDSLTKELDEIKNGPANLLSQARKHMEEENYTKVLEVTSVLNDKFNGVPEDIEGQSLAKTAQQKIDEQQRIKKEEQKRLAAEAQKSAQDKAREIIRVTKIDIDEPNSAGGVDLFIGYKNMSDKVIKYTYFSIVPYNRVGDIVNSDIGGESKITAVDEGPHKKGEGIAGNYNWYWENAWYSWSIDSVEITSIKIEYMDGTSVTLSGDDVKYVQY
jgi:outer membrane murein-binding lipoprotein Lpp